MSRRFLTVDFEHKVQQLLDNGWVVQHITSLAAALSYIYIIFEREEEDAR